ncbi:MULTISPECIES: transposase [Bosea]|uniref:Transposase n=1 Tax=Bosea rubneri TaxID=3075434 RepID=A0ABU3SER1_9HYPH|nr:MULTISPECIES: transposase [unclassified Bosea (in: a-proteobacteria)]MDU0343282.1 transposase [Bosea sp. ZW T0_25]HEV7337461.1 transposase [Bosea sp. (in: a-proteobacteria)]
MGDETYVRRRHWNWDEKCTVVEEAATSGNVIATAKRHGIQAQQIYRWRDRLLGRRAPVGFAAVSIIPDPPAALPAPVPDIDRRDGCPALAAVPEDDRIEIAIEGGRDSPTAW